MTGHPPYPYSDGTRAILGPDVTASADGQTITWQGANYSRHPGEIHCGCGGSGVVHDLGGAAGDNQEGDPMTDETPWCCTGWTMDCALCDDPTGSVVHCPGHPATDNNAETVRVWQLHAQRAHPDYEYATTRGPRKQWDHADQPPVGDDLEIDPAWEVNTPAGRDGWERFDYHEEAYWRRPKDSSTNPPIIGLAAPICPPHDGDECPCPPDCYCCQPEPSDPTRCSGEEGFYPEHGFHRHSLKQPDDQPARTTPDNPTASSGTADNPLREQISDVVRPWLLGADEADVEHCADAMLAVVQPHLDQLADYENRITWHTACASCVRILDSCYAETMRAEAAETQLAALRQVSRGYCPACGRGDAAPTVADWEQQKQRADRLTDTLRQVLDAFEAYWARASYCGPGTSAVQPEHFQGWRQMLASKEQPPAHDTGPSVQEAAADDTRWWGGEKTGEQ